MSTLWRLRWAVAELVIGSPLMRDPNYGKDGTAIVVSQGNTTVIYKPDKFRIRTRHKLSPFIQELVDKGKFFGDPGFLGSTSVTTFAGLTKR